MAKIEKYNNGCGRIIINDINYEEIALDSFKKDLIDWCKADREEWLKNDLNTIYDALYIPTRNARLEGLDEEAKKKPFGVDMDTIKINAMIRYNIERVKMYGSPEKFIKEHGEFAFKRIFCKPEKGSKLDLSWEFIEKLFEKGFN